jgi:uncharacterized protein YktA (UPF0223 family)
MLKTRELRQPSNRWEKLSALASAVTAFSTFLLFAAGAGALIFANRQIQESREQSKIQHLVEVVQQFDQSPMVDFRKSLADKRLDAKHKILLPLDPDNVPYEMSDVLDFFEHIGLLEKRGYLDKNDVWDEFSDFMFPLYADARPYIDSEQKKDRAEYANFTQLMKEMEQIEAEKEGGTVKPQSQEDIRDFYIGEAEDQPGALPTHSRK